MGDRLNQWGITAAAIVFAVPTPAAAAAEPVRSVDIVEASAFLEGYRVASESRSADFYDLYSDRAVVHLRIQDQDHGVAFQGRAFKAWGRQLLTQGRSVPDSSIFQDATVEQRGTRLLIRAKRFSISRCYWDVNYQVGIEREGSSYRIVDERLTTQPSALCHVAHPPLNSARTVVLATPADYSLSAVNGNPRVSDSGSMIPWHPLSQQELADKAMQLAQQLAAARVSQTRANGTSPPDLLGPAPVGLGDNRSIPLSGLPDVTSDLRVTPAQ